MNRTRQLSVAALLLVALPIGAQQKAAAKPAALDRDKIPSATAAPTFKVPKFTVDTLSNGARLVVVERHALPVVNVSIHFDAGTNALGAKQAAAQFLGSLTREGTTNRTADQLTNELAMKGINASVTAGTESGAAGFTNLASKFDESMDVMMDMMLNSLYPQASLDRLRTSALVAYTNGQDNATTVANQVAPKLVYGSQPYGQTVTDADLKAVTREDVANLAKAVFVPANATVYVVGDMTRAQAKAHLEKAFKVWPRSGTKVTFKYPTPPAMGPTAIYLVDMPNKPQSYLRITEALPPAYGPDMAKITMTNYILGGALQSRLSANIREAHGYSYGFQSSAAQSKGPGPFAAAGAVTREKSDSSVIQAMKEIRGMSGARPVTAEELTAAKKALTLSLPSQLQSNAGVSNVVSRIVDEGLPADWWSTYIATINSTTAADVAATARKYFDGDHMAIVVAGDAAKIKDALAASGVAPVIMVDKSGKKITP